VEPLHSHRVFSTFDIDEGQLFASQIWEKNRSTLTDGHYGVRWN
jgi:hypothetical protein